MPTEDTRVQERFTNDQPISEGRIVHYVLNDRKEVRPALVVRAWGIKTSALLNLQVFFDGSNDSKDQRGYDPHNGDGKALTEWKTSVHFDRGEARQAVDGSTYIHYDAFTWHWPPRI